MYTKFVDACHNALVVLVLNELLDDLVLWLNLEHLEDQAEELRRAPIAAVRASHALEVDRLVDDRLGVEREAVLLPVQRVVDLHAHDLVDEVLGVRAVHVALQ